MTDATLRPLLEGGDRRSIARSDEVLERVRARPELVGELAALTGDADWLVAMRAVDLLEKFAHEHPDWVEPHKRLFIGPLADSDKWEVRLQVVRALPLFRWSGAELRRAEEIVRRDIAHPQTFVRAWAADSLARFAEKNPALLPDLERCLAQFDASGSKALATRAREIRKRASSE
ncbi:MAG: hypothetical protein J0H53_12610 [Rhizobiales bacterium]|nr:hypothetical protein [Hyphomicrobiales bacterium]